MSKPHQTDDVRERAVLYALGALDGEDKRAFERELEAGSMACRAELESFRQVVGDLGFSVQPVAPKAGLRERLLARVSAQSGEADLFFLRSSEGLWQEVGAGVTAKVLFEDPVGGRVTALIRMAPGSRYAPHRHAQAEELYVIDGTCLCGGQLLKTGDYHRAAAETVHSDTSTTTGCLALVIASKHNQVLEECPPEDPT